MQSEASLKFENTLKILVLETSAVTCIRRFLAHVPHTGIHCSCAISFFLWQLCCTHWTGWSVPFNA